MALDRPPYPGDPAKAAPVESQGAVAVMAREQTDAPHRNHRACGHVCAVCACVFCCIVCVPVPHVCGRVYIQRGHVHSTYMLPTTLAVGCGLSEEGDQERTRCGAGAEPRVAQGQRSRSRPCQAGWPSGARQCLHILGAWGLCLLPRGQGMVTVSSGHSE